MRLTKKYSRNNLFNVVFSSEKAYPETQMEMTVQIQAKRGRAISPLFSQLKVMYLFLATFFRLCTSSVERGISKFISS